MEFVAGWKEDSSPQSVIYVVMVFGKLEITDALLRCLWGIPFSLKFSAALGVGSTLRLAEDTSPPVESQSATYTR